MLTCTYHIHNFNSLSNHWLKAEDTLQSINRFPFKNNLRHQISITNSSREIYNTFYPTIAITSLLQPACAMRVHHIIYLSPNLWSEDLWGLLHRYRYSSVLNICHNHQPLVGLAEQALWWELKPSTVKETHPEYWVPNSKLKIPVLKHQRQSSQNYHFSVTKEQCDKAVHWKNKQVLTIGPSPLSKYGWWLIWTIAGSKYWVGKNKIYLRINVWLIALRQLYLTLKSCLRIETKTTTEEL